MRIRLLLGPAGSGKTFRCLSEIREQLIASPMGPRLLLVAPKQTTYQLERQLLMEGGLSGYTRLQILSFERLADFLFEQLNRVPPRMLDEEGRLMVLRNLLAKKRDELKLFRASARLTGFAQELSTALRELQRTQLTPEVLRQLADRVSRSEGLAYKLTDLARLLEDYLAWMETRNLQDADSLLPAACRALRAAADPANPIGPTGPFAGFAHIWVDGFAEFSEQELELLAALAPSSEEVTITFCLDRVAKERDSWLSNWSAGRRNFESCRVKLGGLPGADLQLEQLPRDPVRNRFAPNPVLQHLECNWGQNAPLNVKVPELNRALRVALCPDPEAEVTLAGREILRWVRAGGRYRDVTVLVRNLEGYHHAFQRVFTRFGIPLFLDRRESVSHHPLAELTRSALRTVGFQWQQEDWFAALKTGLVPASETEIDRLENEALARGWRGSLWQKAIVVKDDPQLSAWLAEFHRRVLPPFHRLALDLAINQNRPTGAELARALREFWARLEVESTLERWATVEPSVSSSQVSALVHGTVWDQMNAWLENLELAFPDEPLSIREWLPILESGLSHLSVGVIPPALDQVLVGSIERSRNPDIKLALVLGLNESVFPAAPEKNLLLTESDRAELGQLDPALGSAHQQHLGRERHLAYLACTRARERLVLSFSFADRQGTPLNPSPFVSQVQQLFPDLVLETPAAETDLLACEHLSELIGPALRMEGTGGPALARLPSLAAVLEQVRPLVNPGLKEQLSPGLAEKIYGQVLRTSVSRMEQFAACPFRFFVHSGLRAQERQRFELDVKEQGSFQHDVLALFHEGLQAERKRWRDVSPAEARERVAAIAKSLVVNYREGLLQTTEETRFMARVLTESLQDFVETLVQWMHEQYAFDPVAVELPFGETEDAPAWSVPLANERRLELFGRIDRIDLFRRPDRAEALCVVIDYKSSQKQLDALLVEHGLQLQLLAYLNVLRRWPNPQKAFGVEALIPAGVFYVNLRGKYDRVSNRTDALEDPGHARKLAYRHTGRFDFSSLRQLDNRPEALVGDQFNYRLTKNGELNKSSREVLRTGEFAALLDSVEANLKRMGDQVYAGSAEVDPYKKGTLVACDQCDYSAVCRLDPWTHQYRVLRRAAT